MMLNRAYGLLLLTVICIAQSVNAADKFSYNSLISDTPKQLPYGEPVAIFGESSNFKVGDLQLDSWIKIEKIMLDYQASGGAAKTKEVTLSKSGTWNVLLDPLPSATKLSLLFRIEGKITDTRSSSLTTEVLEDQNFRNKISTFYVAAKDKSPDEIFDLAAALYTEINSIIASRLPQSLQIKDTQPITSSMLKQDEKLRANTVTFAGMHNKFNKLKKHFPRPELIAGMISPEELDTAVKQIESPENPLTAPAKTAIDEYKSAYENSKAAIVAQVNTQIDNIKIDSSTTSVVSAQDIQKYAGLDYAAVMVPGADEFRQFVMAHIYYGKADGTPPTWETQTVKDYFLTRLSISLGWDVGDISGNESSKIKDNYAYTLGIGYRFNKFFRISAGQIFYRNSENDDLDNDFFVAVSIDLTGFQALEGLVSK